MRGTAGFRRGVAALCLAACGCSAMRELPREQYAGRAERRHVRVETRDGARLAFDRIHVSSDSLTGFRREDVEGPFDEYETVRLGLDEVTRLSVRSVDWYRTGLIAGVAAAVAVAAVLSRSGGGEDVQPPGGPCGPRPCP